MKGSFTEDIQAIHPKFGRHIWYALSAQSLGNLQKIEWFDLYIYVLLEKNGNVSRTAQNINMYFGILHEWELLSQLLEFVTDWLKGGVAYYSTYKLFFIFPEP